MTFGIDLCMEYAIQDADPALLTIAVARTRQQSVFESDLIVENATLQWIRGGSGLGQRVWALPQGRRLQVRYRARVRLTREAPDLQRMAAVRWEALPAEVLPYLRPSRLCPSDQFVPFVAREFGHLEGGCKIAAMSDWVAKALSYEPGSSNAATTAIDTFLSRQGVCRDFAHVLCSMARAAGIPARYTTGYGVDVSPQDFHAVAEIWLDGDWHIVDVTGMSSATDLAVIGTGRDAGDVAFLETRNWADYVSQVIKVSRLE